VPRHDFGAFLLLVVAFHFSQPPQGLLPHAGASHYDCCPSGRFQTPKKTEAPPFQSPPRDGFLLRTRNPMSSISFGR